MNKSDDSFRSENDVKSLLSFISGIGDPNFVSGKD